MITFIRDSLLRLFYYWKKTLMDRLGRPRQNGYFIVAIRPQYRFSLPPNSDKYWYQGENSRLIPGIHTLDIIQIPIVPPAHRTTVPMHRGFLPRGLSDACPLILVPLPAHCYVGWHLTTLNDGRRSRSCYGGLLWADTVEKLDNLNREFRW